MSAPGIVTIERSEDSKLSDPNGRGMSATYAAQRTCPRSCPLLRAGCYAEGPSPVKYTTWRVNRAKHVDARKIAELEAAGIRRLSGWRRLRVHVVGDCATPAAAALVGGAMADHERKRGARAWTYTHAWRTIARRAWRGARVAASCESIADVRKAWRRGYGAALLVERHPNGRKAYDVGGVRVIPCPAQWTDPRTGARSTYCERCEVCAELRPGGDVVGFEADRGTLRAVRAVLE